MLINLQIASGLAADDERQLQQFVAAANARTRRVEADQTGFARGPRLRNGRNRPQCLDAKFHAHSPALAAPRALIASLHLRADGVLRSLGHETTRNPNYWIDRIFPKSTVVKHAYISCV